MDQRGVTPERPSSLNGSHVEEPTRELLEQIPNLELVEDSDVVAGSGRVASMVLLVRRWRVELLLITGEITPRTDEGRGSSRRTASA